MSEKKVGISLKALQEDWVEKVDQKRTLSVKTRVSSECQHRVRAPCVSTECKHGVLTQSVDTV